MSKSVCISMIIPQSVSCQNRGEDGELKVVYLNDRDCRTRISKQCSVFAMRNSDEWKKAFGETSIRTTNIEKLTELIHQEHPEFDKNIIKIACQLACFGEKKKKNKAKGKAKGKKDEAEVAENEEDNIVVDTDVNKDKETDKVVVYTRDEILQIVQYLCSLGRKIEKMEDLNNEEFKLLKSNLAETTENGKAKSSRLSCMDVALAGRMSTNGVLRQVDGCLSMAHSLSLNSISVQSDYFVASDDLNQFALESSSTSRGAAHLGRNEFSMPVMYSFAAISVDGLKENSHVTDAEAAVSIANFVEIMAKTSPSARQNSMASFGRASYVLVSIGDGQPIQPIDAITTPCTTSDVVDEGIKKISNAVHQLINCYEEDAKTAAFCLPSYHDNNAGEVFNKLSELKAWIVKQLS